jgi:hypothetical protein
VVIVVEAGGDELSGMMAPASGDAMAMSGTASDGALAFTITIPGGTLYGTGTLDQPFETCPGALSGALSGSDESAGSWTAATTPCPSEVAASCRDCLEGCACAADLAGCPSCVAACHAGGVCGEGCSPG